jgi:hypothetical protein
MVREKSPQRSRTGEAKRGFSLKEQKYVCMKRPGIHKGKKYILKVYTSNSREGIRVRLHR